MTAKTSHGATDLRPQDCEFSDGRWVKLTETTRVGKIRRFTDRWVPDAS